MQLKSAGLLSTFDHFLPSGIKALVQIQIWKYFKHEGDRYLQSVT